VNGVNDGHPRARLMMAYCCRFGSVSQDVPWKVHRRTTSSIVSSPHVMAPRMFQYIRVFPADSRNTSTSIMTLFVASYNHEKSNVSMQSINPYRDIDNRVKQLSKGPQPCPYLAGWSCLNLPLAARYSACFRELRPTIRRSLRDGRYE
jgi:hypothetical protein